MPLSVAKCQILRWSGTILLLFWLSSQVAAAPSAPSASSASSSNADSAAIALRFYETERKLALLPLDNLTGREDKEHISRGIPAFLAAGLRSLVYIRVARPRQLLQATVGRHPKQRDYRYSRRLLPGGESWERGRLRLIIEKLEHGNKIGQLEQLSDPSERARLLGAEYLLEGSYRSLDPEREPGSKRETGEGILLELWLFDLLQRERFYFSRKLSGDPYADLDPLLRQIKWHLAGSKPAQVEVESSSKGAMVYLDEAYLGRTPIRREFLPGRYRMRISQEGFKTLSQTVELLPGRPSRFNIQNEALRHQAGLNINSDPPGASVFLNLRYIGKTPLKRTDLPAGSHRLRIAREGHIDRFIGIRLREGEVRTRSVELAKGDTEAFYRQPIYAILDQTYYDLALYSLVASFAFYGGWLYYTSQGEQARDKARFEDDPDRSRGYAQRAEAEFDRGRIGATLGTLSLLATALLFYRGVSLQRKKEFGELSYAFSLHFDNRQSNSHWQDEGWGATPESIAYRAALLFRF